MDNRVLERIVIIILVLLNVFLLTVVLSDRIESRRAEAETVERLTEILKEKGITAAKDAVIVQAAPPRQMLVRSADKESEIVTQLLGTTFQEDLGGNILFYRSDAGQAVFRGSGEVAALFTAGSIPLRGSVEKTSEKLMKSMGMGAELIASGTDGDTIASAEYCCCKDGYPVFNAPMHFDYSENGLYMITGTRLFDDRVSLDGSGLLNSVSALMRFAETVGNGEAGCSRLERCQPGYLLSVVVSGESTLIPVWRLETDQGTYLVNAETGRLESGTI